VTDLSTGVSILRTGPRYWWDSYRLMVRWQLATLRSLLPLIAVVEVMTGLGLVLCFGLFFPDTVPPRSVLFVSTGAPVISLYILGLVMLPQLIGQQKTSKTYDYTQSMPIPRPADFAAWYTMNLLVGVPGVLTTLAAAALRYNLDWFRLSAAMVPATLLIALVSTALGYAIGHAIANPMLSGVIVQMCNFIAFGFAPIIMPPEQLPAWLADVNRWLPFESMGTVMRAALSSTQTPGVGRSYLMLVIWTSAAIAIAGWAIERRD
jgi:ABC-2 type transport system permease protein